MLYLQTSKKNKIQSSKLANSSNKPVISFVNPQSINTISLKK